MMARENPNFEFGTVTTSGETEADAGGAQRVGGGGRVLDHQEVCRCHRSAELVSSGKGRPSDGLS